MNSRDNDKLPFPLDAKNHKQILDEITDSIIGYVQAGYKTIKITQLRKHLNGYDFTRMEELRKRK